MGRLRRIAAATAACLTLAAVTGCTPEELRWYESFATPVPGLPCGEWVGTSRVAGFTEEELPTLHRIMRRESRCNPDPLGGQRLSRTDDAGLVQVNVPTWLARLCHDQIACTVAELFDPQVNLRAARYILNLQGWDAWATY